MPLGLLLSAGCSGRVGRLCDARIIWSRRLVLGLERMHLSSRVSHRIYRYCFVHLKFRKLEQRKDLVPHNE
jgi:hypothetical protein